MGVGLQDRGQAAEGETYFERACLAGSAIGCTNFGAGLLKDATDPMAVAPHPYTPRAGTRATRGSLFSLRAA